MRNVRRDGMDLLKKLEKDGKIGEDDQHGKGDELQKLTDAHIKDYLQKVSVVTDMITIIEPVTHVSDLYGWAGWIHWETSGAHFYSWERPVSFFSVDIYTCKAFDPAKVVEFTEQYFRTTEIVAKGF